MTIWNIIYSMLYKLAKFIKKLVMACVTKVKEKFAKTEPVPLQKKSIIRKNFSLIENGIEVL